MFKPSEKYQIDRRIVKCDSIRYSPSEKSKMNTPKSQIYIKIPREDSVISLLNIYLDLNLDVLHAAAGYRYADGDNIRLVNLAVIASFSIYKLTTSSGKHLEEVSNSHMVSLLYKLLTSSRGSDDLSIGFDRSRDRRKQEKTKYKNFKGKYHLIYDI